MGRLRRIDCGMPGITRRRRGRGFEYVDEYRERITDEDVLERIPRDPSRLGGRLDLRRLA
jgi:DNA topoisomerase-1